MREYGDPSPLVDAQHRHTRMLWRSCAGYFKYPFQNKQVKSCVENLARDVDKEEKIGVVVIISAFL
jgi:hypothetical protein